MISSQWTRSAKVRQVRGPSSPRFVPPPPPITTAAPPTIVPAGLASKPIVCIPVLPLIANMSSVVGDECWVGGQELSAARGSAAGHVHFPFSSHSPLSAEITSQRLQSVAAG